MRAAEGTSPPRRLWHGRRASAIRMPGDLGPFGLASFRLIAWAHALMPSGGLAKRKKQQAARHEILAGFSLGDWGLGTDHPPA
jgi:hypothetical protein